MGESDGGLDAFDVVIVGAGIIGGSCFYELASSGRGLKVACFDKSHKLHGSTARSAAAFRHQFSAEVNVAQSILASEAYERFPERFGTEPVIRRNGYCLVYRDADRLEAGVKRAERQRALGVPDLEVLDGAEAARRFPMLEPEGLQGATFCRRDGFVIPDRITNAWFEAGERFGGCLRQYAAVTGIEREAGRVAGVWIDDQRLVRSPVVINAAGPWAGAISGLAGLPLPVVPVKRYLYFTHQLKDRDVTGYPMLVCDLEPYCRPEANGLMLGWDRRPAKPPGWDRFPPPPLRFDALDGDRIEEGFGIGPDDYGTEVLAAVAEYLPFLWEETGLAAASCGYYEITPDEKAIIDWDPRLPGLLHAAGFSGHGVMHAPAAGRIVRALVLGEEPPVPVAGLRLGPLLANEPREDPEQMAI